MLVSERDMDLFRAIDLANEDEVMRLLDAEPTLVGKVECGFSGTPLVRAAFNGQLDMVKLLTQRGASIHATSRVGRTALHYAAEQGHEEVVVYLLDNGADSMHQDTSGYTPLVRASIGGRVRVVLLLLEHKGGEGVEAMTVYHMRTALHWAACGGYGEAVAHLLRYGAQTDTRDYMGWTALMHAVGGGHVGVVETLVDHMGPQALQQKDQGGRSLLHIAVQWGHAAMVVYLLSKGLSPIVTDAQWVTPLMYAAMSDSGGVLRRLLEHMGGLGVDLRFGEGRTALHFAVHGRSPANVRALLLAGADPTIVDNKGRTPPALAEEKGFLECTAAFKVSVRKV
jgi:ankyrin repeat protein